MNEIKKAIETLQGECGCVELDLSNSNAGEKAQEFAEACHIAVQALHEKAERENPKPLTIDELREMNGEPVWVMVVDHKVFADKDDDFDGWGMCRKSWARLWDKERADLIHVDYDFEDYGKKWLAYRTKPEGSGE